MIVFVGPGVGHLTDLVLPGEGIFQSFFARRGTRRGDIWEANSHIQVVTPFHDIVFIMPDVALIFKNKPAFSQRSEFARFSQMFLSMAYRFVIKCPANYQLIRSFLTTNQTYKRSMPRLLRKKYNFCESNSWKQPWERKWP